MNTASTSWVVTTISRSLSPPVTAATGATAGAAGVAGAGAGLAVDPGTAGALPGAAVVAAGGSGGGGTRVW